MRSGPVRAGLLAVWCAAVGLGLTLALSSASGAEPAAAISRTAVTTSPTTAFSTSAVPVDQSASGTGQSTDFRYSAILFLPLALLIGVAFVTRALTTDATPARVRHR